MFAKPGAVSAESLLHHMERVKDPVIHPMFARVVSDLVRNLDKCESSDFEDGFKSSEFEVLESEKEGYMIRMEAEKEGRTIGMDDQEKADQEVMIRDDASWRTRMEKQEKSDQKMIMMDEAAWLTVSQFRAEWNDLWSFTYGSFEDTTRIPSMRFTDNHVTHYSVFPMDTVQIFSVKLSVTRGHLPLDVFGMVAVRDPVDHNRNIIFQRTRDDCQTLTQEDQHLLLTGPTRAVMFIVSCPVVIEVDLKVKGATESEDECLGPLVMPVVCFTSMYSDMLNYAYTSKHSTLEFKLGHVISTVEATIFVRVTRGSWTDGLRGVFAAFATGAYDGHVFLERRITGIGHERIVLLDSKGEKLPITGDGKIKLSRRVVSAETTGKLIVRVKALEGGKEVEVKEVSFDPLKARSSFGELEFSFCKMEVTVFWSLISQYPVL